MCMVSVFILQTPLAVVHVQRVSSVALQVSLVHLDCVRQDFTVQAETQKPQVEWQNVMFIFMFWIFACGIIAK